MLSGVSNATTDVPVGGRWRVEVRTFDDDGHATSDTAPSISVTKPDGAELSPAVTFEWSTRETWRAYVPVATAGRWLAVVSTSDGDVLPVSAFADAVVGNSGLPTVDDVVDYLDGELSAQWTEDELARSLGVELRAQRDVCRIPATYPEPLFEAALRRVHCNLARRKIPLALAGGDEMTPARMPPSRDPEVRRLEGPYRKLVVA